MSSQIFPGITTGLLFEKTGETVTARNARTGQEEELPTAWTQLACTDCEQRFMAILCPDCSDALIFWCDCGTVETHLHDPNPPTWN